MEDYRDIMGKERPEPIKPRQTVDNRAKQFMPFDALRGFSVAVLTKEKERELLPRMELSEDAQQEMERKINLLQAGDEITVTYFQPERVIGDLELGTYKTEHAAFLTIDEYSRSLVTAEAMIPLGDVYDLQEKDAAPRLDKSKSI